MSCSGVGVVIDDELDRLGGDRIDEPQRHIDAGGTPAAISTRRPGSRRALVDRLDAEEWQQVREVQC